MRRLNLFEAFKSFIIAKPPSFLFLLSLASFFIVLYGLMEYIGTHDIQNPDITDWNAFKESLASLHYCIRTPYAEEQKDINFILSNMNSDPMSLDHRISYSFEVLLNIEFIDMISNLENLTHLYGQIQGYQIGLQDRLTSKETLYISFDLIDIQNSQTILDEKTNSDFCIKKFLINNEKNCKQISIKACANVVGPLNFFPKTKPPNQCSVSNRLSVTSFKRKINAYKESPDLPFQFWCPYKDGIKAIIDHKTDPNLTVMLSARDKEIIFYKIKNCLYSLSIIIAVWVIYGIMKHRQNKIVIVYQQLNQL